MHYIYLLHQILRNYIDSKNLLKTTNFNINIKISIINYYLKSILIPRVCLKQLTNLNINTNISILNKFKTSKWLTSPILKWKLLL